VPLSFYKTYLQPLFYNVLNTRPDMRESRVLSVPEFRDIPYLNGGLFREVVDDESGYNIDNDILEVIVEDILRKYTFTLEDNSDALNPDILGLVFEKTINYIAGGDESDKRKDLGAYYTPDDVTTYISKETIRNRVFDLIRRFLEDTRWKAYDINEYNSLEDFLDKPPLNPKTLNRIYDIISTITVLDPACGSGHFLTSVMKELFYIRRSLASKFKENVNNYEIKKDIISRNLFGVDIENTAVEIARLRLWLSLIEDLDTTNAKGQVDTLPNIEYNIEVGNSLIGYTEAPVVTQTAIDLSNISVKNIFEEIDELKQEFRVNSDPTRTRIIREKIEKQINLYNETLNNAFVTNLASDYKVRYSVAQLSKMNPFHWRIKFSDVFARKEGFDVIVGNPPYIESTKLGYPTVMFSCQGNTYAHFLERSMLIACAGGYVGFIVPLATVCTDRMIPLHDFLKRMSDDIRVSNFDDRPGKIFQALEHCRSSIIICKKKEKFNENTKIFSTKYNRWYTKERA
jgi:SAM-dependent methyltransferase